MRPNLFSFATSELSQDAVLGWLLAWAPDTQAEHDVALQRLGRAFLELLFERAGVVVPEVVEGVEVRPQVSRIDVYAVVNDRFALVLEDKVGSLPHSGQLERYLEQVVGDGGPRERVLPIYVQTGEQGDYGPVREAGYHLVHRRDLLGLLEGEVGRAAATSSDVVADFAQHLRGIEDEVKSYLTRPLGQWSWLSWQGFYTRLQDEFGEGGWGTLAYRREAFQIYYWHGHEFGECTEFLQLEDAKLCHKMWASAEIDRRATRLAAHERFAAEMEAADLRVSRPRFRSGENMTVSVLEDDYRVADASGCLDVASTLVFLRRVMGLLDRACEARAPAPVP